MQFKYLASTAKGELVRGVIEADSESGVEKILWASGLTIIELKKKLNLPPLHEVLPGFFGVKQRDIIDFSRDFASLLEAGIPVLRALQILADYGSGKPAFKYVLRQLAADLQKGNRLSEAFAKHPAFPKFYVHLIRVGEEVGNLSTSLNDVANHMEKDAAVVSKVKGALAYPAFVMLLAVAAIVIMMTFVVPNLTKLFKELGGELPLQTRILISLGDFFQASFVYIIIGVVVVGVTGYLYLRTPSGRRAKDALILRIPVIGGAILKSGLARFCTNMSMMVGAGIPVADALTIVSETCGNVVLAESLNVVRSKVGEGQHVSQAMSSDPIFPSLMVQMMGVGEETGSLESSMTKVAKYYEDQADRSMARVTGMLTPAITLFVGLIIGYIAVAMYGSIYSVSSIEK